ncbi:hypothetical protein NDU88_005383 [Pleurodeles waltl]|uniref:Uncharacterized protein n=1 Tax=Pleurodeles waltl TaxID=8319 RepID=A0AAV7UJH0_PLEWA|nr:hypothetical protein NDU88_005383 [Pleurodeles waltl]
MERRGGGRTHHVFLQTGPALPRRQRSVSRDLRSAARRGPAAPPKPNPPPAMADEDQPATMAWILQEITAVSRTKEGMDASISSLTLETKSIRTDIAETCGDPGDPHVHNTG